MTSVMTKMMGLVVISQGWTLAAVTLDSSKKEEEEKKKTDDTVPLEKIRATRVWHGANGSDEGRGG